MLFHKPAACAVIGVVFAFTTVTSAFAMQSAVSSGGIEVGIAAGITSGTGGPQPMAYGDLAVAIPTHLFGFKYTQLVTDGYATNTRDHAYNPYTKSMFGFDLNSTMFNVGIVQPVIRIGNVTLAAEGGLDSEGVDGANYSSHIYAKYLGGRASLIGRGSVKVNALYRYRWALNMWQTGLGISGPLRHNLDYQLDYWAMRKNTHMLTAGIRYFIPTGAHQKP